MRNIIYALFTSLLLLNVSAFAQTTNQTLLETSEYKIQFPATYENTTQTVPSALGDLLMKISYYEPKNSTIDSNNLYMLMETEYPDSTIHSDNTAITDVVFEGSINGAVKSSTGKLISQVKGTTGNYPDRTIEIDYQNGSAIIKIKMILFKRKMIMLQTITNTNKYPNLTGNSFFRSFTFK